MTDTVMNKADKIAFIHDNLADLCYNVPNKIIKEISHEERKIKLCLEIGRYGASS